MNLLLTLNYLSLKLEGYFRSLTEFVSNIYGDRMGRQVVGLVELPALWALTVDGSFLIRWRICRILGCYLSLKTIVPGSSSWIVLSCSSKQLLIASGKVLSSSIIELTIEHFFVDNRVSISRS